MRRHFALQLPRWGIALGVGLGLSLLLAITVWATGQPSLPSPYQTAAQKQAQMQQIQAQETAAARLPHAPKPTPGPTNTPVMSCPNGPVQSRIDTVLDATGIHEQIDSIAHVAPNMGTPFFYVVYAGALSSNPQQGVLIVVRLDQDPCAPTALGGKMTYYPTLYHQQGALTLTQVSDSTVTFTTASGGSGHFDVVTGQYT
jgi:hypothetical protein